MPEIIHLLSEKVANQIAAGEVVQRPSSAIKELIENALDAEATEIQILTKKGGKTLIQVIDNGKGMVESDAKLSFSRHATSKIRYSEDLFQIKTMGFRGEALASMAAVSQMRMKTRHRESNLGTEIRIEASKIMDCFPVAMNIGTNIELKNLFYNIPARRNFLKSDTLELKHILSEIEKIALTNPMVYFRFSHDEKEILHLPKGTPLQRIIHLFGHSYSEKVLPVEEFTDIVEIRGYIGKPEFVKKIRGEQFFYVNGRFIRNIYLHNAVMAAYKDWIAEGNMPFYSIHLNIDPSKIDINIHPSKTEVKFQEEQFIHKLVQTAVKKSLGKFHLSPQIDFDRETHFDDMSILSRGRPIQVPQIKFNPDFNPFQNSIPSSYHNNYSTEIPKSAEVTFHTPGLFDTTPSMDHFNSKQERDSHENLEIKNESGEKVESLHENQGLQEELPPLEHRNKAVIQIQKEYILSSIHSGLILFDQQAMHERILFERYCKVFSSHIRSSQKTLFPKTYTVSAIDMVFMDEILPDMKSLGFEIRPFGKNTFILEGMPVENIHEEPLTDLLEEIISYYRDNKESGRITVQENLSKALAKKMSIKSGRTLTLTEMLNLIDELFACQSPMRSPSGKPTYITISQSEIKKKFKE